MQRMPPRRVLIVDDLQREGQHPTARVAELTPRLQKQRFASSCCTRIFTGRLNGQGFRPVTGCVPELTNPEARKFPVANVSNLATTSIRRLHSS
jgi:hypothetical protein